MTIETLKKANKLQAEISVLEDFIYYSESNRWIRIFKKKGLAAAVSDYMREVKLFELSQSQRERFIQMLKDDLEALQKELKELVD